MPPSRTQTNSSDARAVPYTVEPKRNHRGINIYYHNEPDKENQSPTQQQNSIDSANDNAKRTPNASTQRQNRGANNKQTQAQNAPTQSEKPSSYLDIVVEELEGEVPVYENAAAIRRKLSKLLESKEKIPGTDKTWNKTNMSRELCTIAHNSHPIKVHQGVLNNGSSVNALTRFLKNSGGMGGGDTETYYWANVLLEKLRIRKGEKKTKAREKAEQQFPKGRARLDPKNTYITCMAHERPSYSEVANYERTLPSEFPGLPI